MNPWFTSSHALDFEAIYMNIPSSLPTEQFLWSMYLKLTSSPNIHGLSSKTG